jgi:DNA uptake protein ComE-like DNA-binding protein
MEHDAQLSDLVRARWVWLSLIPMGLGAWAPIYAGVLARRVRWCVVGAVWSILVLAGWAVAAANRGGSVGGVLIIAGWTGGAASSFVIRALYQRSLQSPYETALVGAEQRVSEREHARRLAKERPAVAKELGVGRPDLPHARDAGLVDVNNAPASVLAALPGVDTVLASRIVEAREETHGFTSVEDLGITLDLDGQLVEDLRQKIIFLPR